ncbi:MAG: hypothetical protein ACI4E2_04315 [Acetatifactor sp.]
MKKRKKLMNRIWNRSTLSLGLFGVILLIFLYGVSSISGSSLMNGRDILEQAIRRDIVHCYANEGMYPPSLAYLENHYGLTYDREKYIVQYENIGSNIMPTVTIIERKKP